MYIEGGFVLHWVFLHMQSWGPWIPRGESAWLSTVILNVLQCRISAYHLFPAALSTTEFFLLQVMINRNHS